MNAPQVTNLRIDQLSVDHNVQRPLDQNRAQRIADELRPEALGVIVVNRRDDGTYHVIDGQHRTAAKRLRGEETDTVRCLLYIGLTPAEEAEQFRLLNTTRAVNPVDRFRVRVVEGDPVAVQITAVLTDLGWTVRSGNTSGTFAAVAAIDAVYRGPDGKGRHLDIVHSALQVLTKAWGHEPFAAKAEIVSGLGSLLHRHGDQVDAAKLVHELAGYPGGPRKFLADCKGRVQFDGGTVRDAVAARMVQLINGKRKANILPPWDR